MKQEPNLSMKQKTQNYQIYVLVGVPGSGKSTFAWRYLYSPVVSRDTIRAHFYEPEEDYFAHETEVYKEFIETIVDTCKNKHSDSVVIDATHINKASRRKLFRSLDKQIKGQYDTHIIFLNTPLETCLRRNQQRQGFALVPEDVLHRMYKNLQSPTYDEHDSIKEIWEIGGRLS